jgi:hypothetical protein
MKHSNLSDHALGFGLTISPRQNVSIPTRPSSADRNRSWLAHLAVAGAVMLIATLLSTKEASAHHLCRNDSGGAHGQLFTSWQQSFQGLPLGCVLSMQGHVGDGDFLDFENGEIVWSPAQQLAVVAYTNSAGQGSLNVSWRVISHWSYDHYIVRWAIDPGSDKSYFGQQDVSFPAGRPTWGNFTMQNPRAGRYAILVEGCDSGVPATCRQGWSNETSVDVGAIDVSHKVAYHPVPLPPALTPSDTESLFLDHLKVAFHGACAANFGSVLDESFAGLALGKLFMSDFPDAPGCNSQALIDQVNNALGPITVTTGVGTDYACHTGDYDMALAMLIPLFYEYSAKLTPSVRNHVLHDLLNQDGGIWYALFDSVIQYCGSGDVYGYETENHMLNIETARYLTNQLRLAEYQSTHPGTPPENIRLKWDNHYNNLDIWMLQFLQGFLKNDFHEYNARPYARLSIGAIHNLAEYADYADRGQRPVKLAAQMVLDYIAAKFAVSSNLLRRSVPFRRHEDHLDYTPLFQNYSDEETWWFVTMAGNTQLIDSLRYGRADWGSGGDMGHMALGKYRIPDVVLDLILGQAAGTRSYFQRFRHEGVEIYVQGWNYLLSGGGDFEDNTPADQLSFVSASHDDTNGAALPTTVMPMWAGDDRKEFVQITGDPNDRKKRFNSCVAPGFACGLGPYVPMELVDRTPEGPRPCTFATGALFTAKWMALGGADGPLGCPLDVVASSANGSGQVLNVDRYDGSRLKK